MLIKGILYTHCPELNRYESVLQGKEKKFSPHNSKYTCGSQYICGYQAFYTCSCPDINAYSYNALEKSP